MFFPPRTDYFVLLLKSIEISKTWNTEGYIQHEWRGCEGNDFIGGHWCQNFNECYAICEAHVRCVAFMFHPYSTTEPNCLPKSDCGILTYNGDGWFTYKKMPGRGGCTFDDAPGFALYGHNDGIIVDTNVENCQKKCLWNKHCLSFDYKNMTDTCFISHDSRETEPSFFNEHHLMTYYHKRCGTEVNEVPASVIQANGGGTIWMKNSQCIKTFGPYGGRAGRDASYEEMMYASITEITVGHARYINSIVCKYGTSTIRSCGGSGGTKVTTRLLPGEHITSIEGRSGGVIDKLLFITNQRSIGPFGSDGGSEFSVDNDGKPLLYISCPSGSSYVVRLSFHFAC